MAPYTFGRQLVWALSWLRCSVGIASRCERLLKAVLDSSDEILTCELGLQVRGAVVGPHMSCLLTLP